MPINFRKNSILDSLPGGSYPWSIGTGSTGVWTQIGGSDENERLIDTDPFGDQSIVWECQSDGISGPSGGWDTSYFSLNQTKLYRFSVWVRKKSSTNSGLFYLGCAGTGAQVDNVYNGVTNSNPYWSYTNISTLTQDVWYLFIGHIFPVDYVAIYGINVHPNSGVWTILSGKTSGHVGGTMGGGDCKFNASTTGILHRTYHYYSINTATRLQFYDPRIELCDGSEGTIESLLLGPTNYSGNTLGTTSITLEGNSFKNQKVIASGGDEILEVGEWRIHKFTSSGSFVLQSYVGSSLEVNYLIVGGGGGGGTNMGGGGGGGGVLNGSCYLSGITYVVTVGGGGSGAAAGTGSHPTSPGSNGDNSSFNGLTAYGGGYGGLSPNTIVSGTVRSGNNGGCGGGSTGYNNDSVAPGYYGSGSGTTGQGYRGGYQGNAYYSGGGGGAGAVGSDGNNKANGGNGKLVNILGRPYYWGGGGGGAGYSIAGGNGGKGGGGGGAVGYPPGYGGENSITWGVPGTAGATVSEANIPGGNGGAYSGGGGGGGSHYNYTNAGGNGGSGIVLIRYKYR